MKKFAAKSIICSNMFLPKNFRAFSLVELSIVLVILGILVTGATQGTALVAEARLYSARNKTKNSPAASIPDLSFWVEATSEKSFAKAKPSDGEAIRIWKDINPQSGYSLDLDTIPDPNNNTTAPTYKEQGISNLPVLYFNGAQSIRKNAVSAAQFLGLNEATLFFVQRIVTESGGIGRVVYWQSPYNPDPQLSYNRFMTYAYDNGWNHFLFGNCCPHPQSMTYSYSGLTSQVNVPSILSFRKNGNIVDGFFNGRNVVINNAATSDINPSLSASLYVGVALYGYVGEVIIFARALNDSERQSVEAYLSQKWKIALRS